MSEHELWNELGNLYFMSGAYNQAVYAYHRSIQLDGGFGRPYSNLALTYVQQGKYEEAVELYRRSLELLADDKEKAISWNRLGNVHRRLKQYHKAVVAYQQADELDPESTEGREEPGQVLYAALDKPSIKEESKAGEAVSAPQDNPEPVVAFRQDGDTLGLSDDSTASWIPAEPIEYQQDLSESPKTGSSLTTWGPPNADDGDLDGFWPPEPEPDDYVSDPDGDDLAKWLPIPEEEPQNEDDPASNAENTRSEVPEATANHLAPYQAVASPELTLLLPARSSVHGAGELKELARSDSSTESLRQHEVEVAVEERPAADFVLAIGQEAESAEERPEVDTSESGSATMTRTGVGLETATELPQLELDPQELRELEAEIAKFKRVVQINPRNAHAWDALGTLYKCAGHYRDAILAYQQAISSDSSKALYYHHLGLVYACEGRNEDAVGAFQRVIEIDPDYSLAHATLGGYYRKMGLEELAQEHIGKAMKSIFDSENEYNRACLQAICGNADQAIELLRVALKNKQTYVDWILRDPDLDFIRQDPRFKQLISDYTR